MCHQVDINNSVVHTASSAKARYWAKVGGFSRDEQWRRRNVDWYTESRGQTTCTRCWDVHNCRASYLVVNRMNVTIIRGCQHINCEFTLDNYSKCCNGILKCGAWTELRLVLSLLLRLTIKVRWRSVAVTGKAAQLNSSVQKAFFYWDIAQRTTVWHRFWWKAL